MIHSKENKGGIHGRNSNRKGGAESYFGKFGVGLSRYFGELKGEGHDQDINATRPTSSRTWIPCRSEQRQAQGCAEAGE